MERRQVAMVLAGLVLVGSAVVGLRLAGGRPDVTANPPPEPSPTMLRPYSVEGILAPTPGPPPPSPGPLTVVAGPRRLQLTWLPGRQDPTRIAGYEVRWGSGGSMPNDLLVAEPAAELDGLTPGALVNVEVWSVDSYGQRSLPAKASGTAWRARLNGSDNALVDDFAGPREPDPRLWQLASASNCAQADHGTGPDHTRLVILSECGQVSATLRARTPFRLRTAASGELGRFTIDTDSPGENGELDVDLVPGSVTMIDGSPNDSITATPPGAAMIDDDLPPGTIRVRIAATVDPNTDRPSDTVQVAAGPQTPMVPIVRRAVRPIPQPMVGISERWDVVLRTDGVEVLRDGVLVGSGNVVPAWRQATALAEFSGPSLDQQRDDVNMIGFGGAPTSAPALVAPPTIRLGAFPVVEPGSAAKAAHSHDTGPGSALLRATVVVSPNTSSAPITLHGVAPDFAIRLDGRTYATTPAVPGTQLLPDVRYSLVGRVPASALAGQSSLAAALVVDAPTDYQAQLDLISADLDVTPGSSAATGAAAAMPAIPAQPPELANLSAQMLDASGRATVNGQPLPRGRAVLQVAMDGVDTERTTGRLAGLAGFKVWLDGKVVAAVPTAVDGPGIDGSWDIAFATGDLPAGAHSIDIRAYGTTAGVMFAEAFASFQLAR